MSLRVSVWACVWVCLEGGAGSVVLQFCGGGGVSVSRRARSRLAGRMSLRLVSAALATVLLAALLVVAPGISVLAPQPAEAQTRPTRNADGSFTVPADWALKPSGLGAGDRFRLLFSSFGTRTYVQVRDGTVADFHKFVRDAAGSGHSALGVSAASFNAVVNTKGYHNLGGAVPGNIGENAGLPVRIKSGAVSSDVFAMTTGALAPEVGGPVYWLNGAKIADDGLDLLLGNWDSDADRNESGNTVTSRRHYTGLSRYKIPDAPNIEYYSMTRAGRDAIAIQNNFDQLIGYGATSGSANRLAGATNTSYTSSGRFPALPLFGLSPEFVVAGSSSDPTVSISASGSSVAEGNDVSFTVSVTPAQAIDVDVFVARGYTTSAAASRGASGIRTVSVPVGGSAMLTVTTEDDSVDDPGLGVTATIVARNRYQVSSSAGSATASVTEDDSTSVSLSGSPSIVEGSTASSDSATVMLARELVANEVVDVPLSLSSLTGASIGGATPDFTVSATGTGVSLSGATTANPILTFSGAGAQNGKLVFTATSKLDSDTDGETVTVGFGNLSDSSLDTNVRGGVAAHSSRNTATLTIVDDQDLAATVKSGTFPGRSSKACSTAPSVNEYGGPSRIRPVSDCFILDVNKGPPASAGKPGDPGNQGVIFVPSVDNGAVRVSTQPWVWSDSWDRDIGVEVWAINDKLDNPGGMRTAVVSFSPRIVKKGRVSDQVVSGYQLPQVTVTVVDIDPTVVTLGAADSVDGSAKEGVSSDTAKFKLSLGRGLVAGESLVVPLTFSGATLGTEFSVALDGSPSGVAYSNGAVTFTGPSDAAATLAVTASSDSNTVSERVSVAIPAKSGSTSGLMTASGLAGGATGSGSAMFVLVDSASPVTVGVPDGELRITEGSSGTYTLTLTQDPSADVTISFSSSNTTVLAAPSSITITDDANWANPRTVTLRPANNNGDTADTTVTISHSVDSTDSNYQNLTVESAKVVVVDDDPTSYYIRSVSPGVEQGDHGRIEVYVFRHLVKGEVLSIPIRLTSAGYDSATSVRMPTTYGGGAGVRRSAILSSAGSKPELVLSLPDKPGGDLGEKPDGLELGQLDLFPGVLHRGFWNLTITGPTSSSTTAGSDANVLIVNLVASYPDDDGDTVDEKIMVTPLASDLGIIRVPGRANSSLSGGTDVNDPNPKTLTITDDDSLTVPSDWPQKPHGLSAGDKFRLLFVTTIRDDADSCNIDDYDYWAMSDASNGIASIRPYVATFKALISTKGCDAIPAVPARNGLPAIPAVDAVPATALIAHNGLDGTDAPIYWLAASPAATNKAADYYKAADDYDDFLDGSWDQVIPTNSLGQDLIKPSDKDRGIFGGPNAFWTGSDKTGAPKSGSQAGQDTVATGTVSGGGTDDSGPLGGEQDLEKSETASIYVLSQVFTVGTDPTPAADPVVSITAGSGVTEGSAASFTVTATPMPSAELTVNVTVADASNGGDFVAAGNEGATTVTVPTSGSVTLTVATASDSTDEPNGAVSVTVNTGTGYTVSSSAGSASVNVADDDATTVTYDSDSFYTLEGAESEFSIVLGRGLVSGEVLPVELALDTGAGAASLSTDFTWACESPLPSGVSCNNLNTADTPTVTFTGGSGAASEVDVIVSAVADNTEEVPNEFVAITLGDNLGSSVGTGLGGGAEFMDATEWNTTIVEVAELVISPVSVTAASLDGATLTVSPKYASFCADSDGEGCNNRFYDSDGLNSDGEALFVLEDAPTGLSISGVELKTEVDGTAALGWPNALKHISAEITLAYTGADITTDDMVTVKINAPDDSATGRLIVFNDTAGGPEALVGYDQALTGEFTIDAPAATTPEVQFGAATYSVGEASGGRSVNVVLNADSAPSTSTTINYNVAGSATSVSDFTALSGTATLAANASSVNIAVAALDDSTDEPAETIILTLARGTGYTIGTQSSTTVTITDDDATTVTLTRTAGAAINEGSTLDYTLSLNRALVSGEKIVASLGAVGGAPRATRGTDYTLACPNPSPMGVVCANLNSGGNPTVTFTGGTNAASSVTITLSAVSDNVVEASGEKVNINIANSGLTPTGLGGGASAVDNAAVLTINDAPATDVSVALSASAGDVAEDSGSKDFTVTLGRVLTGNETVTVPLVFSGATVTTDFTLALQPASQTGVSLLTASPHSAQNPALQLAAGASTAVLRFAPVDNEVRTQPYVTVSYGVNDGTTDRAPSGTKVTIETPSGGPFSFIITDDETGDIVVPADWMFTPPDSEVSAGEDFRLIFTTSGSRVGTSTDIADYDHFVRSHAASGHASLRPYAGFFRVVGSTATVDADDHNDADTTNDGTGEKIFWLDGDKVADDYADFWDNSWDDPTSPTDESGSVVDIRSSFQQYFTGTDTGGNKLSSRLLGTNTPGTGSLSKTVAGLQTPIRFGSGDTTSDYPFYGLSMPLTVPAAPSVPVTLMVNNSGAVTEGGTLTVTATLDEAPSANVMIPIQQASGGTAVAADFTLSASGVITVNSGSTSGTLTFTAVDDNIDEANETLSLGFGTLPEGYSAGDPATAAITITDNDAAPTAITLTVDTDTSTNAAESTVAEEGGAETVRVTATVGGATRFGTAQSVTVSVGAGSDSATSGTDYTAVTDKMITIAAGADSGMVTFTFTPTDDDVDEGDESVTLSANHSSIMITDISFTITDDDTAGVTITESSDSTSVGENGGTDTYTVVLDSKPTANVTVEVTSGTPTAAQVDGPGGNTTPKNSEMLTFTTTNWATAQTVTVTGVNDNVDNPNDKRDVTLTHAVSSTDAKYAALDDETLTVEVTDDDPAPTGITLSVDADDDADDTQSTVAEGGGAKTVRVTATVGGSTRFGTSQTVTVAVGAGSTSGVVYATSGTDYTAVSNQMITIDAGAASGSATFTFTPTDDDLDEGTETVSVSGMLAGVTFTDTSFTITDNDTSAVVITETGTPEGTTVSEDGTTTTDSYSVKLATKPAANVTVTVTSETPAAAVLDGPDSATEFNSSETLTFTTTNWNNAQTIDVQGVNDDIDNTGNKRSVTFTHDIASTGDTKYNALADQTVTVEVSDDDDAPSGITLSVDTDTSVNNDQSTVAEGGGTKTVRVTASVNGSTRYDTAVTVTVAVGAGSTANILYATEGTDYTTVADQMITIAAGAANNSTTFMFTPANDTFAETAEVVDVSGTSGSLTITGTSFTITDNETVPGITLTAAPATVAEGDGATTVAVTATVGGSVRFDRARTVVVSVAGSGGSDLVGFTAVNDFMITIPANTASGSANFTLTPAADDIDEDDETITVSGVSTGPPVATVTSGSVSLTDDDTAGVTISKSALSVAEAAGTATYTVVLDSEPTADVTVTMTSGTPGAATVDGSDAGTVGSASETLTFTSSTWDTAQTVTVIGVNNDRNDAGDQRTSTVAHTVASSDSKYNALSGLDSVSVTVTDDDGAGVTISESTRTVAENAGTQTYTVVLDSEPSADVTVTITSDTPAAARVDGPGGNTTPKTSDTLTFTSSNWNAEQTVTVTGVSDNLDNTGNERSAKLTHAFTSSDTDYSSIADRDVTVTVTDDDDTPEVDLSVDLSSVAESAGSTTVTVTATVDDAAIRFEAAKTVRVTVMGSAGDEFVDFTIPTAFDLTIASGAASGTETFALVPTNDLINERDETVTVSGASTGLTVNSASLMLTDDEADPIIAINNPDVSTVTEGQTAQFVVMPVSSELSAKPASKGLSAFDLTINLTVTQTGSFVSSSDSGEKTVTLPALAEQVSYDVDTVNDDTVESNGRVTLSVRSGSGYMTAGGSNSRYVTVNDNDTGVAVNLSIDDATITEDDSTGSTITVTLASAAPSGGVNIPLTTTNNTAANSDYSLSATSVTISSGQTTNTVKITATGDTTDEPSETFTVALDTSNLPAGYAAGSTSSVDVTIADNDATTVTLTRAAGTTLTEGSTLTYTLTLGRALVAGEVLPVPLAFSGTATRGTDYTLACASANGVACAKLDSGNAMVTFTGGTNAARVVTITLTAATDNTVETSGETVNIGLGTLNASSGTNLGGGASGTDNAAVVTINDPASTDVAVTLSVDSGGNVTEGGTRTITATLASAATADVTIPLTTAVSDYSLSETGVDIDISNNTTSGTVTLTATDDNTDEPTEQFTVGLGSSLPAGYKAGTPSSVTITIADNDPTTVTLTRVAGASITEGSTLTYTLRLGRRLRTGEALAVPLTFTGSADRNTDYMLACPTTLPTGVACANLNSGNAMVTFTGSDSAATAVTITLTATTDNTVETSGETVDIGLGTLNASSGTNLGGGATGTDSAAVVTITDPPVVATASVTVTQTGGTTRVAENGGTDTYTIVLGTEPTADVVITVTSSASTAARIDGPDAGNTPTATETLTFTSGNYNTAQTVTVTGVNDNIDNSGNQRSATISHSVTSSSASEYRNVSIASVTVVVTDDDPTPTIRPRPSTPSRPVTPAQTVAPTPEPEPEPEPVFEDLTETSEVHREAVTELANEGVFERVGCQSDQLCPDQPVKRWQLAVILIRQLEGTDTEPETDTENTFTDVEDVWWSTYVQRLSELELTRGCTEDSFCPDQQLTRGQAAQFLAKAFGLTTTEDPGFGDIENSPHIAAINALYEAGITLGCSSEPLLFCPDDKITIQQLASLLARAADVAAAEAAKTPEPELVFEDLAEIPEVHRQAVTELAEEGVFEQIGCETDQLCADQPVKRWQLAVIIVRQLEGTETEPETDTEPTFTDVEDIWWSGYVQRLSELELTRGCTENSFCPDQQLTRGQAAQFLVNAFDLTDTSNAEFNDIEGSPHTAAINTLFAAGITNGCSSEPLRFCPDDTITLQELATMITRAAEKLNQPTP